MPLEAALHALAPSGHVCSIDEGELDQIELLGPRELVIHTSLNERHEVHAAVQDSGVGLPEGDLLNHYKYQLVMGGSDRPGAGAA